MFPSQKSPRCMGAQAQSLPFNGAGMFPSQKSVMYLAVATVPKLLQWGRDVSIPEMRQSKTCTQIAPWLQWGRDVSIPEIAMPLFYSVFNDLRACSRAPLHLKHNSHSRTLLRAANSCRPAPLHPSGRSLLTTPA